MSDTNIEKMKKLIEAKKNKGSKNGSIDNSPNKGNAARSKGFKNTKKSGSLNK